ncbi:dephospho-CoA kinase [Tersicoccus phoenicis]|uniref:Dephospho-CoA kinase n=1 Tax=Tersicoccus phoenicis TaxID=554083 RepID=A0A1R1LGT0_9MICC|nr:dephospho-CoA kinase [Tersicoccus phoenicis]OMH26730.1 dephospho-CoA kinase [Tersicoccus phoenicis]
MLTVGLTGGIAAGKSVVAARLRELGAVLIDADVLAREVVAPGTDGLAAVVDAFGSDVLTGDGDLDRGALGGLVFGDDGARATLNGIVHPRVRAEAARRIAAAPRGAVIVQDIPLLVETGQEDAFHLVVVVQAAEDDRIRRMVEQRGMSAEDARSRIAAQATDEQREAAADVVLANSGKVGALQRRVDELWHERILPFNENLLAGRPAARARGGVAGGAGTADVAQDGAGTGGGGRAQVVERIARRLARVSADLGILRIERVEGAEPVDVLMIRVVVPDQAAADRLVQPFADAGFPRVRDARVWDDRVPGHRPCWLHRTCDPGKAVDVQVCASAEGGSG